MSYPHSPSVKMLYMWQSVLLHIYMEGALRVKPLPTPRDTKWLQYGPECSLLQHSGEWFSLYVWATQLVDQWATIKNEKYKCFYLCHLKLYIFDKFQRNLKVTQIAKYDLICLGTLHQVNNLNCGIIFVWCGDHNFTLHLYEHYDRSACTHFLCLCKYIALMVNPVSASDACFYPSACRGGISRTSFSSFTEKTVKDYAKSWYVITWQSVQKSSEFYNKFITTNVRSWKCYKKLFEYGFSFYK